MKKTLIRAVSFLVTLSLLTGLLAPLAGAVEYEGVTSLSIDAKSALLIDMDTEQVLYEQAADEQRYPASITKIMTALLTLEAVGRGELDLNDVITMDDAALADLTPDSSTAGLQAGEEITVRNLLYCLLLASANEAANALAIAVAGDIPAFVEQMNQRAQELGMSGTHFVNPHGLHSDDHYTTARDIFKMAKQAMTHATFREIVSTGTYTVPATNLSGERTLYNTNALLTSAFYPGYTYSGTIGIKTGSTGQAGYCVTAASQGSSRPARAKRIFSRTSWVRSYFPARGLSRNRWRTRLPPFSARRKDLSGRLLNFLQLQEGLSQYLLLCLFPVRLSGPRGRCAAPPGPCGTRWPPPPPG